MYVRRTKILAILGHPGRSRPALLTRPPGGRDVRGESGCLPRRGSSSGSARRAGWRVRQARARAVAMMRAEAGAGAWRAHGSAVRCGARRGGGVVGGGALAWGGKRRAKCPGGWLWEQHALPRPGGQPMFRQILPRSGCSLAWFFRGLWLLQPFSAVAVGGAPVTTCLPVQIFGGLHHARILVSSLLCRIYWDLGTTYYCSHRMA